MAGRGDHLGVQPHAAKLVGHPLGRPAHVVPMLAVGTDAGNAQQLAQLLLEPLAVSLHVVVNSAHSVPRSSPEFFLRPGGSAICLGTTPATHVVSARLALSTALQYNGSRPFGYCGGTNSAGLTIFQRGA